MRTDELATEKISFMAFSGFFFFDSEGVLSLFQMQTGVLDFIMAQAIRLP